VGQTVRLSWLIDSGSDGIDHFVVEAGFAPGATFTAFHVAGSAPALDIANVPTGRYFVRLRAVNAAGISAPTTDLIVDVP